MDPQAAGDVKAGDAGTAPETTTQTPAGELTLEQAQAELGRLAAIVEQSKREKSNLERTREENEQLRQRQAELEAHLQALTMQGGQPPGQSTYDRLMNAQRGLMERAQAGDDEAALMLEIIANQRALGGQVKEVGEVVTLKESEREGIQRVRAEARKRGENITPETARRLLKLDQMEQEPEVRAAAPAVDSPPTRIQPVAPRAASGSNPTTFSEYGDAMRAAKAAGNDAKVDELMSWRRANPSALKPD